MQRNLVVVLVATLGLFCAAQAWSADATPMDIQTRARRRPPPCGFRKMWYRTSEHAGLRRDSRPTPKDMANRRCGRSRYSPRPGRTDPQPVVFILEDR